jgi:hypothetical protein
MGERYRDRDRHEVRGGLEAEDLQEEARSIRDIKELSHDQGERALDTENSIRNLKEEFNSLRQTMSTTSSRPRYAFKLSPPKPFAGLAKDDFLHFRSKMDNFCKMNNMTGMESCDFLPHVLEGAAYTSYQNFDSGQQTSYNSIMDGLAKLYGPVNRKAELYKDLFKTKQQSKQSVSEFASIIQRKMHNLSMTDSQQIMYQFISALLPQVQNAVLRMRPADMQEAISFASLAESTVESASSVDTNDIKAMLNDIKTIQQRALDSQTVSSITDPAPVMAISTPFPSVNLPPMQGRPQIRAPPYQPRYGQNTPRQGEMGPPAIRGHPFCRSCNAPHPFGEHINPMTSRPPPPLSNMQSNAPPFGVDRPPISQQDAIALLQQAQATQQSGSRYCMWHETQTHATSDCKYLAGRARGPLVPRQ